MKYCVIIPEGIADLPHETLDGRTPLEAAGTPNLNRLAAEGRIGDAANFRPGVRVNSENSLLSILGLDPRVHLCGRGGLEAMALGIPVSADAACLRCNLVAVAGGIMADHSAGNISEREVEILLNLLNAEAPVGVRFHLGQGYRCLMTCPAAELKGVSTTPPQNFLGQPFAEYLPPGESSALIADLTRVASEVLSPHEINRVRADLGENPANMIWLWGEGPRPILPSLPRRFGVSAAMCSRAAFAQAIAQAMEIDVSEPLAPTEDADEDFTVRARLACDALETHDLVIVHLESLDEASHRGDPLRKTRLIEQMDRLLLAPLLDRLGEDEARILIAPGHFTASTSRAHRPQPVPFLMHGSRAHPLRRSRFIESAAASADLHISAGHNLLEYFLHS